MTLLSYPYIFLFYFSSVKLQITDTDINSAINTSEILEQTDSTTESRHVTILGALSNDQHIQILNNTNIYSHKDLNISSQSFIVNSNPLLTMLDICEIGNKSSAKVIISGHSVEDDDDLTLTAISYIADFYHIPVITITSRQNIFSDKVSRK